MQEQKAPKKAKLCAAPCATLPQELVSRVLAHLLAGDHPARDVANVARAAAVCRTWQAAASDIVRL